MKILVSWFTAIMAAVVLSACGGGGGGSVAQAAPITPAAPAASAPAPAASAPAPAASAATFAVASQVPASGATGVAVKTTATVVLKGTNVDITSTAGQVTLTCNGMAQVTSAPVFDVAEGTATYGIAVDTGPLVTCLYSGTVSVNGANGAANPASVAISGSFMTTCTAPTVWVPGTKMCAVPQSTWTVGEPTLPAGCTSTTAKCFLSVVDFGATNVVYGGRAVYFAFFQNPGPTWHVAMVYGDGTLVPFLSNVAFNGGSTAEIDRVFSTDGGFIVHFQATGLCMSATGFSATALPNQQWTICPP